MRVGYDRIVTIKETIEEKSQSFLPNEVDKVVIESYTTGEVYPTSSRLTRLIESMKAGDTLVVMRLESVSESARVWRQLLKSLQKADINLEILLSPSLKIVHWLDVMTWWQGSSKSSQKRSRIITINKENKKDAKKIRALSRSEEERELYWRIFKEIQQGASLRQTAKGLNISQGTVLRIKRDVNKLKQVIWLVGIFFITIASLKIAQAYSNNWLLQVLICGVAAILIICFSYSDLKEID